MNWRDDLDAGRKAALAQVGERLGYRFNNLGLLEVALTHRSAGSEWGQADNERLEFLGDAVLELISSEWLYRNRPDEPEGLLTQRRSRLVSSVGLKQVAERLELGEHIWLSVGEERSGGRMKRSVLADTVEAVLGAIYLDGGLQAAQEWILPHLVTLAEEHVDGEVADVKNRLQELVQSDGGDTPEYRTVAEDGPPHARSFEVECWVDGRFVATGSGSSKKQAQRSAARAALVELDRQR